MPTDSISLLGPVKLTAVDVNKIWNRSLTGKRHGYTWVD